MRIAFLTPEYPLPGAPDGGLANYLAKIAPQLQERGREPVIFLLAEGGRAEMLSVDGVPVVRVPAMKAGRWKSIPKATALAEAWRLRGNALRLARAVLAEHRRAPFALAQAASYLSVGLVLAQRNVLPVTTRVSSYTPMWRSCMGWQRELAAAVTDWLEVRQLQLSTTVFCPSKLLQSALRDLEGIGASLVPTPFLPAPVAPDPTLYREHLQGRRYLLFVGTMSPIKGADVLARALPPVLRQQPDLHVAFAGRDDGLGRGRTCTELIESELGFARERLHLLGRLDRAVLAPIVENAHLVVLPSRVDNLPNTCLEAQAAGRIVVATRGSSLDELVEEGVTGFLAERGDVESLTAALERALALTPEGRAAMERAVADAVTARPASECIDALLAHYERTIARWQEGRR